MRRAAGVSTVDEMAPPRLVDPQGLYHVMSRGNFRQTIYLDEAHYAKYLRLLDRVAAHRGWIVIDWCLIPNHNHLVLQLTDGGLSEGMRELNGCYSRWSNLQTGRTGTGHLVKNRFRHVGVETEGHFWNLVPYVPLNPVVARLCESPADWPWSGYRATVGLELPRSFHHVGELLRRVGKDSDGYRSLVSEAHGRPRPVPWSDHARPEPTAVVESQA
jgi:REP-associated tyrosine transposase